MRPQIIAMTKTVVQQTAIKFDVAPELTWQNCTDDNSPPYRATITASFRGKPTLAQSNQQVDTWVAGLAKHGWTKTPSTAAGATRYLTGPDGFSMTLVPHLDPVLQRAAYFVVSSGCVITEDLSNAPDQDVSTEVE